MIKLDVETRLALESLNNDFCYYLDHQMVDELLELFTEDAIYTHGSRRSDGRDEIRTIFDSRTADSDRTARHMQTGLRLTRVSQNEATGQSVCMTFAENALPPIDSADPYLIADFIDEYHLCDDNKWRISKRHIERIFVSKDNQGPVGQK
jgi:hypothetical protein